MKFGHNLPRNQVPEWSSAYIEYKSLKKLINHAVQSARHGNAVDMASREFFFSLDRNLESVEDFYNKKYAESSRRLRLLHARYGQSKPALDLMDNDEQEHLFGTLQELRTQLRKLRWYGEVNRRGFVKITKKLDKKVLGASAQESYLASKVDLKPFASGEGLSEDMRQVNDWLSSFEDVKISNDSSSIKPPGPTRIVSSQAILSLPSDLLGTIDQAIRNDDSPVLAKLLLEINSMEPQTGPCIQIFEKLLLGLLQRTISCRSEQCMDQILSQLKSLDDEEDIDQRNCIHRLVISIGRSTHGDFQHDQSRFPPSLQGGGRMLIHPSACSTPMIHKRSDVGQTQSSTGPEASTQTLTFLLSRLRDSQRCALQTRDSYGRMPLHYAAAFGLNSVCRNLLDYMREWNQIDPATGIDQSSFWDLENMSPLYLSVINDHVETTKMLISVANPHSTKRQCDASQGTINWNPTVLAMAVQNNSFEIVRALVEAGWDVNCQDQHGELPLHIAARFGHLQSAQILLLSKDYGQNPLVDVPDQSFEWTPLFTACVNGHLPLVRLLLANSANASLKDSSGWTPKEHASLRGHMDIVDCLSRHAMDIKPPPVLVLPEADRGLKSIGGSEPFAQKLKPVKSFGHRYLENETMILISLGSMDTRKQILPVVFDAGPLTKTYSTQLDTALSIVVSAVGADGDPAIVDLPAQESISTEPVTFLTKDISRVKLLFDIVPTYAQSKENVVGRGIAILSSVRPSIGLKRMNLQGDVTVPIVAAEKLDFIGCVNFNFLVITPFTHPNMSISEGHTYWKSMTAPLVIGHRGLGKNLSTRNSLQLGENTISSFIAAANLGASYVEFDVQLTKDHVPVIYHDFLVSETGIDAPVHTLTLEQFLHVSESQTPHPSRPSSPPGRRSLEGDQCNTPTRRPRSYSAGGSERNQTHFVITDRMKHTRDFKAKGWKANMYGNVIKEPFTTLEEMFKKLPETIGFNIELKYPMLFESEEQEMDTYGVELNSFVDVILTKVYDLAKNRNIIFSSFHPDICLLLSLKQPSIPVLFLTDAGVTQAGDIRAQSLQQAIRFASRWNLLGIVSAAEPFVMCPRLVRVVKESGLVCVSYGALNNEPENVKRQVAEGIDAVIVDRVAAFRKGLTGDG